MVQTHTLSTLIREPCNSEKRTVIGKSEGVVEEGVEEAKGGYGTREYGEGVGGVGEEVKIRVYS